MLKYSDIAVALVLGFDFGVKRSEDNRQNVKLIVNGEGKLEEPSLLCIPEPAMVGMGEHSESQRWRVASAPPPSARLITTNSAHYHVSVIS